MGDVIPFDPDNRGDNVPEVDYTPEQLDRVRRALRRAADSTELDAAERRHPSAHNRGVVDLSKHRKMDEHRLEQLKEKGILSRDVIIVSIPDESGEEDSGTPIGSI